MLTNLLPDGNIRLVRNMVVRLPDIKLTVSKGFKTDGASIPWFLGFIGNHFEGDTMAGAVVHDAIYSHRGHVRINGKVELLNRATADYIFYIILRDHCPRWKAPVYYAGVRLGGWMPWYFGKHSNRVIICNITTY